MRKQTTGAELRGPSENGVRVQISEGGWGGPRGGKITPRRDKPPRHSWRVPGSGLGGPYENNNRAGASRVEWEKPQNRTTTSQWDKPTLNSRRAPEGVRKNNCNSRAPTKNTHGGTTKDGQPCCSPSRGDHLFEGMSWHNPVSATGRH